MSLSETRELLLLIHMDPTPETHSRSPALAPNMASAPILLFLKNRRLPPPRPPEPSLALACGFRDLAPRAPLSVQQRAAWSQWPPVRASRVAACSMPG